MKKSLRDIADEKRASGGASDNCSGAVGRQTDGIRRTSDNDLFDGYESIMDRYGGKSEKELLNELYAVTAKQKAEGTFDPSALQKGVEAIAPMLTEEQRRRLYEITGKI